MVVLVWLSRFGLFIHIIWKKIIENKSMICNLKFNKKATTITTPPTSDANSGDGNGAYYEGVHCSLLITIVRFTDPLKKLYVWICFPFLYTALSSSSRVV